MTTSHSGFTTRTVVCKNCKRAFDVQEAGPAYCPRCETPYSFTAAQPQANLLLQQKLYGTSNIPVFNEGLGTWTTGKSDRRAKAAQRDLIPRDE